MRVGSMTLDLALYDAVDKEVSSYLETLGGLRLSMMLVGLFSTHALGVGK